MNSKVFPKVFFWMFIGLLVTFVTGYVCASSTDIIDMIYGNNLTYLILAIIELGLAIFLAAKLHNMNPIVAKISYIAYTFFSGVTFSSIFIVYELESILLVFLASAVLFLIFAIIGHTTKVDITKFGSLLAMILFGVIICMIINIFLGSEQFDIIISCCSVAVFLGYIAYDIQKVKKLSGEYPEENLAIYRAFQLYLDFINVLIDLLRLFGNERD